MKNSLFLLLFVAFFVSCSPKAEISVFNNSEVDRVNEMVEICLCSLSEYDPAKIVILDENDKTVPSQILYEGTDTPKALLFPVTIKAGVQSVYTVREGETATLKARTNARFVPERKQDFSWENDRIGFRMYGPASLNENLSSGVDVWLKKTKELVLDKWYKDDMDGKASYHEDHGEGLDCYDLKNHSLGAGGICPYSGDSLWIGRHFDRQQILDNGPLRSSFVLYYDVLPYGSKKLKAELLVKLDAGSNLNEAVIRYTGDTTDLQLAAGLSLHDTIQSVAGEAALGYIGYAEYAHVQNPTRKAVGRCYTGVVFTDDVVDTKVLDGQLVGICNYKMGDKFRYFFGAGWSRFGFPKDSDWFRYLSDKRTALQQPLKVKILK
jgi:hypothetical protein